MANFWNKNTKLISATNALFDNELMSDITFSFDENNSITIHAHSFELSKRSEIFFNKFKGTFEQNKLIPIRLNSYHAFYEFIKFFYFDDCKINKENAFELLSLAKEYKVPLLEERILGFITKSLNIETACFLLDLSIKNKYRGVKARVINFFNENYMKILKHENFLKTSQGVLVEILKINTVNVSDEFLIFKRVMDWAQIKCMESMLPFDGLNKRQILGNALYQIRFPVMTSEQFGLCISQHPNLLSPEEISSIFINISVKTKNDFGFSDEPRKIFVKLPNIKNLQVSNNANKTEKKVDPNSKEQTFVFSLWHTTTTIVTNKPLRSIFILDKGISLIGFNMYSVVDMEPNFIIQNILFNMIKVDDADFNNLLNVPFTVERKTWNKKLVYGIKFSKPAILLPNIKYQLVSHYQCYPGQIVTCKFNTPYHIKSKKMKLSFLEGETSIADIVFK